jgi:hypothetical protein
VEFGPGPLEFAAFANIITGRLNSILALNEETLVVASESGGLWRTEDATNPKGPGWTVTSDDLPNLNFGTLARDPSHPEVLYAGTGSVHGGPRLESDLITSSYGIGIYRSSDAGRTWALLPGSSILEGIPVAKIWVDPQNSENLLVGVGFSSVTNRTPPGLLVSRDRGRSFQPVRGFGPGQVFDLASHPTRPGVILAARAAFQPPLSGTVVRSADGGKSWAPVQGLPSPTSCYRLSLASAATDPDRFYALVQADDRRSFVGLFTSSDAGRSWVQVAIGQDINKLLGPGSPISLAIDATDNATVYLGSVNLVRVSGIELASPGTTPATATRLTGGTEETPSLSNSPHVDHRALALSPSGALLDCTDGGLYRLRNPATAPAFPATGWENLNGAQGSLRTIQFTGIALHPTRTDVILGGTQDNGSPRFDGLFTWDEHLEAPDEPAGLVLGDGGKPVIEEGNPDFIWVQVQEGELFRSVDGGETYFRATSGIDLTEPTLFFTPIAQVLEGGRTTLATGRSSVWETSVDTVDQVQWSMTSGGPLQEGALVSCLAYQPGNRARLWVGTDQGTVLVRTTAGGAFQPRSGGLPPHMITALVVDPADPNRAYCSLAGTGLPHVFVTRDGGQRWTSINGNLADLPVLDLALEVSDDRRTLFAATLQGVFASTDEGANWSRFGTGLPSVEVRSLALNSKRHILAAGTYGRGLWLIATRPGVEIPPPPLACVRGRGTPFPALASRLTGLASVPLARRVQLFLDPGRAPHQKRQPPKKAAR